MDQMPQHRMEPKSSNLPPGPSGPPAGDQAGQSPPHPAEQSKESIKETIESILVAFILAFVFRAFVVEAFVIPSGSMAPTLLGAHMEFRCDECGYPFEVNYPATDMGGDDIRIPSVTPLNFSIHCPNCGLKVQRSESTRTVPVYYGDRILVLKYLYLLQEPARWDVVVFKSPAESSKYTQNFIKRLVGKPGETVMILDGDIYICPNDQAQPVTRNNRGDLLVDNWPWQVQTKPRKIQEALWRVVYDNDFIPRNAEWRVPQWVFPWDQTHGTGWSRAGGGRVLLFDNPIGSGKLVFNKDANPGTYPLTDWLPYNETKEPPQPGDDPYTIDAYARERIPRWYVSDLKIQFAYRRIEGNGPMRAALSKLGHTFTAELLPDKARLLHQRPDGTQLVIREATLDSTGELNIELTNVDYQVTLRVNGRDLIQTTPDEYRPDLANLLALHRERERLLNSASHEQIRTIFSPPRVELSAEQQTCRITHLSLWRDVYYTPHYYSGRRYSSLSHGSPERPVRLSEAGKATGENADFIENEYFVLGDNSILSGDARNWLQSVDLRQGESLYAESGRVPERFMLGKAFFVYWPAGYRPFSPTLPGIIPDFGNMRFIH